MGQMKQVEQEDLDVERHGFFRWSWYLLTDAIESINNMFTDLYARRMFNALDANGLFTSEYILTEGDTMRVGKPLSGPYVGKYVMQRVLTPTGFAGTEGVDYETYYSKTI